MTIITYKNSRSTAFFKASPQDRAFKPRPVKPAMPQQPRDRKSEEERPRGTLTLFHPCLQG
ncbi:MAG: hypothetical protein CMK09_17745 [Ponticaulis sp.]|nr:hypothetical protein [Ponticaulis sp.]